MLIAQKYPSGAGETFERFADYNDVGGIKIAHKRMSTAAGEKSDLTVDKVEIDPTIDADAFAKPKS